MAGLPHVRSAAFAVAVALVLSTLFTDGNAQCFSATINCQGASSPLGAVRDCCVGNGISYNDGSGCRACYVIGYSEASRDLNLDEGESNTLTVEVIKPAPGLTAPQLIVAFQIDNTANTDDVRVGGQSAPTGTVVAGPFGRSVSYTIRAEADQVGQEGEETFTIPLSVTSVGLSDPVFVLGFAMVTVTDLSSVVVELTEADYQMREGQGSDFIVARVSYSRDIVNPITVRLVPVTYTEYAARGFTLPSGFPSRDQGSEFEATVADFDDSIITVTLPGPNRQVSVSIPIVDDMINEHQQTFVGYIVIADAVDPGTIEIGRSATQLIINDNDNIVIGFTQSSYTFPESDSGAFVTLAKDSGIVSERNDIAVSVSLSGPSSATQSVDFTVSLLDSRIDFDFEQQTFNIPISIINDELPEGTESFTLSVMSVDFGFASQRQDTFETTEVFIQDNDNVVVGLEETLYEVQENVGTQQVCVRVFSPPDSAPLPNSFTIVANTIGGTATSGSDFGPFNDNLPTFDQNNRRRCFDVPILEDNAYENTEQFQVSIASVDDVTVMPIAATIRIIDMDELVIGLQETVYTVNEGPVQVTVCAEVFEGIVERDTVVSLSTSDNTAENVEDYLETFQLFTFRAGATPVSCTGLQIVDNSVLEDTEDFNIQLATLEPRVTLRPDQGSVVIIDDDTVRVGFEELTYNINENGGSVQICVVIDEGQADGDFTVTVGTADDTAQAGQDYTALQNVALTFSSPSTRECTRVSITNDQIFEADEIFFGRLSSSDSRVLINQDRDETRVFIADDDRLTIGFRMTTVSTLEGDAARLCAAVLTGTIGRDVSINFGTQDLTAQAGSDYFTTSRQLEFDPANTERCVDVQTVEDTVFESPEQFRALLTGEVARLTISPNVATVTIEDDDSIMARIGFVRPSYTVVEGDGNVEVEVQLLSGNIPAGNEVVVTLSTADSSARASSDYQSRTNIPLTFSSTNNRRTVSIPIIDDSEIENVETFLANLVIDSSRFPAVTVSPDQTTVNIISDDVRIGFVETAYEVSETDGGVSVDLRLLEGFLAPELGDIIVGVDTNDITASDSLDYSGFQTEFTFNADNQGFSFSIPIIDDQEIEPTERFVITATTDRGQFPGVTLDPSRATVDIEDNDVVIGFIQEEYTVNEDDGTVELIVSVLQGSIAPGETRIVTLSTSDDTARSPMDYRSVFSERLTFSSTSLTDSVTVTIQDDTTIESLERFQARLSVGVGSGVRLDPETANVNIIDNDVVIGFTETSITVMEMGNAQCFVSVREGVIQPGEQVVVRFTTAAGSATGNQDYTPVTRDLTFDSNNLLRQVLVPIVSDSIVEGPENFFGRLTVDSSRFPNVRLDPDEKVVNIQDNNVVIGFERTMYTVNEGTAVALVAVVMEGEITQNVVITLSTADGTAQTPGDYSGILNRALTFRPGQTRQTVMLPTRDDAILEDTEQFTANLEVNNNLYPGVIIRPEMASVDILDSDRIRVVLDIPDDRVDEDEGPLEVCVRLDPEGSLERPLTVNLNTRDDTARDGTDYNSMTFVLEFNQGIDRLCRNIPIVDDQITEIPEETFIVSISSNDPAATVDPPSQADITIVDNDMAVIGFEDTLYRVAENAGTVTLTVSVLEGALSQDVRVRLTTEDGTATRLSPSDYSSLTRTLTFDENDESENVVIPIIDDNVLETIEDFLSRLALLDTPLDVRIDPPEAVIEITDFGDGVTIGLDRTSYTTDEDSGTIEVCARLIQGSLERSVTVDIFTTDSTAVSSGANPDFTARSVTLTFDPSSNLECIDVPVTNDDDLENDERFLVGLMTDDPDVTLDPSDGDVLIVDDDDVTLGFEETLYSVGEEDERAVVCVIVMSGGFQIPVTTTVNSFDGSATSTAPIDYTSVVNEVLTFRPAGSTRECVTVPIRDDNIDEEDEDFTLRLVTTQDDVILNPDSTRVVIVDDDDIVIGFERTVLTVPESERTVELCAIIIDGSLERNVDVVLATQPGTAQAGVDYSSIRGTTLRFSENSPSSSCVNVPIREDNVLEDPETFTATLTDIPSEGIVVSPDLATITITDTTEARFGFEQTMYSGVEGTDVSACVVLRAPTTLGKQVILTVTSEDISANAPGDYVSVDTDLTFQPGDRRDCVTVTLNTDDVLEDREQLRLRLDTDEDRVEFDPETTVVNVIDEGNLVIGLEDPPYTVNEDDGELMVCALLIDGSVDRPVTVVLSTQPGTASSGADYTPITVDLEFESGSTRECTQIPIVDDLIDEEDEVFDVTLTTNDPDVELAPENGMVTIIDDDVVTIGLERTSTTVDEDDGTVEVCASIMGSVTLDRAVKVDLSTLAGTATAIADYTAVEETLTFDTGTNRECVDIPVVEDDNLEEDEDFDVILETPDEDVILRPPRGNIVIRDRSEIVVGLERTEYTVNEGEGPVRVCTILMEGTISRPFTVLFSADDPGTATPGLDYAAGIVDCPFSPTVDSCCVDIDIFNALTTVEDPETFTVSITTGEPGVITRPEEGIVTIIDDDAITPEFELPEYTVPEPDEEVTVCVTLPPLQLEREAVVSLLTSSLTATGGVDYSPQSFQLTFQAGSTRMCIDIRIDDDRDPEDDERFCVIIPASREVNPGAQNKTVVTIIDDDVVIGFDPTQYTGEEGGEPVLVNVTVLEGQVRGRVVVNFRTRDGTARSPGDYAPVDRRLTFDSNTQTITVPVTINPDQIDERPERLSAILTEVSSGDNDVQLNPDQAEITIVSVGDVQIGFEETDYSVNEEDGSVTLFVRVLSGELSSDVEIGFTTRDGTATSTAPRDYTSTERTLTFGPGNTRQPVTVPINNDDIVEDLENFFASLTLMTDNVSVIVTPDEATVTIFDRDASTPEFELPEYTVPEDGGPLEVCVVIPAGQLERDVPIALLTRDLDATGGVDYRPQSFDLTFVAGSTRVCTSVEIEDDDDPEDDEMFMIDIIPNPRADPGPDGDTKVTILDNDVVIGFEDTLYFVRGNDDEVTLPVSVLEGRVRGDVVVRFRTRDGTARASTDYVTVDRVLTFNPSRGRILVPIDILSPLLDELPENFFADLTLVSSGNDDVQLRPDTAEIRISPVDAAVIGFERTEYTVNEEDGSVTLVVLLREGELESDVEINFATEDGTATTPRDYSSTVRTLTFGPSDTRQTVTVNINNDDIVEELENLFASLTLGTPGANVEVDPDRAEISIVDNDDSTPEFEMTEYTVPEDGGPLEVCVVIPARQLEKDVVVTILTRDLDADGGVDYRPQSFDLTFVAGSTRVCTSVEIEDDRDTEDDEMFTMEMTRTPCVDPGPDTKVTILDNDVVIGFEDTLYVVRGSENEVTLPVSVLEGRVRGDVVVRFRTRDGTATASTDYVTVDRVLTFNPSRGRILVPIDILSPLLDEPLENFFADLTLVSSGNDDVQLRPDTAEIRISPVGAAVIGFERTEYTVNEGAGTVTLFVRLMEGRLTDDVEIDFVTEDGTATSSVPRDYTFLERTLTFGPSNTRQSVTVNIVNDDILETIETLFASLSLQTDGANVVVSPDRAQISIIDNDVFMPEFEFPAYTIPESDGPVTVCIIVSQTLERDIPATFRTVDGTARGSQDYSPQILPLTFAPGTTRLCPIVPIITDDVVEDDERFIVRLEVPDRPTITTTVTIIDDDVICRNLAAPAFGSVTLTGRRPGDVATYRCNPGFDLIGDVTRVCQQDTVDWSGEAPICQPTCENLLPPRFGSVSLNGRSVGSVATYSCNAGFTLVGPEMRVCVLINPATADWNARAPICERVTVRFALPSYTFIENELVGTIEVIKTGVSSAPVNVLVSGGPSNQRNIERSAAGINEIITFPAGPDGPNTIRVSFNLTDDDVALEDIESYVVDLTVQPSSPGVTVEEPERTRINVLDDDEVTVMFGSPEASFNESDGEYRMCIVKDSVTAQTVTVPLFDNPGTAGRDEDYRSVFLRLVSIPGNEPSTCFTGVIIDDLVGGEGTESFTLVIGEPTQPGVNRGLDETTINIIDDDIITVVMVRPRESVPEASGEVRVCAIKDIETAGPVSAVITTAPGKAADGEDYRGGEYTVTFGTEVNAQGCARIGIVIDGVFEDLEDFDTNLSPGDVVNVVVGDRDNTVVIIDDLGDDIVNDTLIGDPLLTVPLAEQSLGAVQGVDAASLCYEIHGRDDAWFNLLSDGCVSVNAHYFRYDDNFNFVDRIAIRAVDERGNCKNIMVDLEGCTASIDGTLVTASAPYCTDGLFVRPNMRGNRVRVSVPNCDETSNLVMWTLCQRNTFTDPFDMMRTHTVDMIKFQIARGFNLGASSHGLIGQFWNIPISVSIYTGPAADSAHGQRYMIQVQHPGSDPRIFTGLLAGYSWEQVGMYCFYVGNRQGGTIREVEDPNDSVIEGSYADYMTAGDFSTEFTFSHFDEDRCS